MLYLVSFPDPSLWILSKLCLSISKASTCSDVLLLTIQYFSWPVSGSFTVYSNRCTFFPSNSCSTGSIFSGSNNPSIFSSGWRFWNLLDFLLSSSFRLRFSFAFWLSSCVLPFRYLLSCFSISHLFFGKLAYFPLDRGKQFSTTPRECFAVWSQKIYDYDYMSATPSEICFELSAIVILLLFDNLVSFSLISFSFPSWFANLASNLSEGLKVSFTNSIAGFSAVGVQWDV